MIEQKYIDQFVSEWLENEQNQSLFYHFIKERRRIKGKIFRGACEDFGEMISDELLDELIVLIGYRISRMREKRKWT